jgi:hypothetical protein
MTSEEDTRRRPVVFRTRAEPAARARRRPLRVLAGATLVLVGLAGATGVALGGSAVWTGVGPNVPSDAPLWPVPPTPIRPTNQPALAGNSTSSSGHSSGHDDPATHDVQATTASPATTGDRQRGKGTSGGGPTTTSSSGSGSSGRGGSSGDG